MKKGVMNILEELLVRYPGLEPCRSSIEAAYSLLEQCYKDGGKVLICGNGGSASDSEHIVSELMKGFLLKRRISSEAAGKLRVLYPEDCEYLAGNLQGALPAISLVSQSAISTAFSNDVAPDMVFAQQVYGYAKEGDVLIGISTSGNSRNVINALKTARAFGVKTVGMTGMADGLTGMAGGLTGMAGGLTGMTGGLMKDHCDALIQVPATETYKIQEYHLPVYHALCAMLEVEFFT